MKLHYHNIFSAVGVAIFTAMQCLAAPSANAASLGTPQTVAEQEAPSTSELVIGASKSALVHSPSAYTELMIADPKIADVVPVDKTEIDVIGKTMGTTALTIYGPGKRVIMTVNVVVSADLDGLKTRMHEVLPNETNVAVSSANQSIVLSGTASSPSTLQQELTLADTYDPGKVVNMMTVQGTQQVMLSVRFVEMERTAAKNLGLNVQQTPTTGTGPQVSVQTGDALVNAAAQAVNSTFGSVSLLFESGGGDLSFLFDALETKGLTKTLAEPTLVAMSGDTANFLAGGEIPIPVPQTGSQGVGTVPVVTIQYKQYGISLGFTPTILRDGLMNMVVNPEVSALDPTNAVIISGISIPAFTVRRAHTTVELRDGESFTIAGLLADNYQNTIRQLPFVGDIPILGALFRDTGFQSNQTELVIVVTPHLVSPRKVDGATPADQFIPPSDFELFLYGSQRGTAADLSPEDRALLSIDPSKGGVEGPYGHVLY
jgi:pilus assembly protein CpaC